MKQLKKRKQLVFDIETNGFYDQVTRLHCMVIMDKQTGELFKCVAGRDDVSEYLQMLTDAEQIIGHNIIGYDLPVLQKLYPSFTFRREQVVDTMILSRLIYPNLSDHDWEAKAFKRPPGQYIGLHKLEAWGYRLGYKKLEYDGGFEAFCPEMLEYNVVDVEVTNRLYEFLLEKKVSPVAVEMEHQVAFICTQQEIHGFAFDVQAAEKLAGELQTEMHQLEKQLQDTFKPWVVPDGQPRRAPYTSEAKGWWGYYGEPYMVPVVDKDGNPKCDKKGNPKMREKRDFFGYRHQPIKFIIFNPGSRYHVANRLQTLFGWKPKVFTDNGQPKVDEDVLVQLPWPEAQLIAKYYMIQKRLALLIGKDQEKGWLNVERNGRVHGSIITNGAVTGRGTHKIIANIPRVSTPYGKALRALFMASKGRKQVGIDMSGIELRIFAHYLARYDGGAYGKIVCEGDEHWANVQALGLTEEERDPDNKMHALFRDGTKTFIYAFLYGAGNEKIGRIIFDIISKVKAAGFDVTHLLARYFNGKAKPGEKQFIACGKKIKEAFTERTPGLQKLTEAVAKSAARGYLIGLDGRMLYVRKAHAALNTLLQSAAALLSKRWLVEIDEALRADARWAGKAQQLIWYHDEVQFEVEPKLADDLGKLAVECITRASTFFKIRVPTTGEYKVGNNWADCH